MKESRISALMDGELEQGEALALLASLKGHSEMQQDWLLYHTIGDSLRQARPLSPDFETRFSERLAKEPTMLAPHRFKPSGRSVMALSAAASLAAVSLVVWAALQLGSQYSTGQMANNSLTEFNQASADPALNVNNYLVAHQEYSRTSQQESAYQKASFESSREGKR